MYSVEVRLIACKNTRKWVCKSGRRGRWIVAVRGEVRLASLRSKTKHLFWRLVEMVYGFGGGGKELEVGWKRGDAAIVDCRAATTNFR